MTFHLKTDRKSFQFHIIYIGMSPLKKNAATRTKEEIESIKHVYIDLDHGGSEALNTRNGFQPNTDFRETSRGLRGKRRHRR